MATRSKSSVTDTGSELACLFKLGDFNLHVKVYKWINDDLKLDDGDFESIKIDPDLISSDDCCDVRPIYQSKTEGLR